MARSQKTLSRWLRLTGLIYGLGALNFMIRPESPTDSLGQVTGQPMEREEPGMYHALAVAYMATISAMSLSAAADPEERSSLIPPLLVAKAVSSAGMLYRFKATGRPGYAAGAVLDAALFGITAGLSAGAR